MSGRTERGARAEAELSVIRGEMARVDGKCSVLAGVSTGAAAFAATQAGHGPLPGRIADAAAGVAFTTALLVLLSALRPRLGERGWCRWAVTGLSALDVPAADLAVEDLPVFARLAATKFRRVRLAVDLIGAAAVLLAAAIVTGVIA